MKTTYRNFKITSTFLGDKCWNADEKQQNYNNHIVTVINISYIKPKICTKLYNCLDGEPDTPIQYMKKYEDVELEFFPKRIVWR